MPENEVLLESPIATTVQLIAGERCALAASSGLVNLAPDFESKRFLATQTLDEARHVEIFTQRLFELLEATSRELNPKFAQTLSGTIADERRHVGFGENRIGSLITEHPEKKAEIERMQQEMSYYMLATFTDTFTDTVADSGESVEEGRKLAAELGVRQNNAVENSDWHGTDLDTASVEELVGVLADTVLGEFKVRLGRIGIDYRSPSVPA